MALNSWKKVRPCAAKTSSLPDRRDGTTTEFEKQSNTCEDEKKRKRKKKKKKKKKKKHVEKTEEESRN